MSGIVAAILFSAPPHQQLKVALNSLKSNADSFKEVAVNYVHENQAPHLFNGSPAYHTIGISSASATVEDRSFYAGGDRPKVQPGAFLLTIGNVAMYAVDRNGTFELIFASSDSALMNHHGALLTEALNEQKA